MTDPSTPSFRGPLTPFVPPMEQLIELAARYTSPLEVEAAGFRFGAEHAGIGDVAVVNARGGYRRGVIVKKTKHNVRVEFTTEGAIHDAADLRTNWNEPFRSTKTSPQVDVAVQALTGDREYDHSNSCVGCGASVSSSEPCDATCPFETAVIDEPTVLRGAARRVRQYWAPGGYDVRGAIFAAATAYAGAADAERLTDRACSVLHSYLLTNEATSDTRVRAEFEQRLGVFTDLSNIAPTLYAAAARHAGIDFDADEFGDLPA